jgi:hypothetical protein
MRVAGSFVLSLLLLAPGCAWGSDSIGPNQRWGSQFIHEQIRCNVEGVLVISFKPASAVVSRGDEAIASASLTGRRLSDDCETIARGDFRVHGGPRIATAYGNAEVVCRLTERVAIQAHPIMEFDRPAGSVLLVLRPSRSRLLASIPLKRGGSRLYYDRFACNRIDR